MKSSSLRGIFCFRRDLRLHDNLGLNDLSKICEGGILPIFCLDPRQLDPKKNQFRSPSSVNFLYESLLDLDSQIRDACTKSKKPVVGLTVMAGTPEECIPALVKTFDTTTATNNAIVVGWNEDVTPFAQERDRRIEVALKKLQSDQDNKIKIEVKANKDDVGIVPLHNLRDQKGQLYKVATPFCRGARAIGIPRPLQFNPSSFHFIDTKTASSSSIKFIDMKSLKSTMMLNEAGKDLPSDNFFGLKGGRAEALKRIAPEVVKKKFNHYNVERDWVAEDKTTKLSPYFKFGCVSYREAHQAVVDGLEKSNSAVPETRLNQTEKTNDAACEHLCREIIWASFFLYIVLHFPETLAGQLSAFAVAEQQPLKKNQDMHKNSNYDADSFWANLNDPQVQEQFRRWKTGTTGFPIIDAAMREMLATGWMHNRGRGNVASFLTKILRIDWREGEKYFAQNLVDYDASANNGNWQAAASTGVDQKFRIFNPWMQASKFDPKCEYIKQYVPELRSVPVEDILKWNDSRIRSKYAASSSSNNNSKNDDDANNNNTKSYPAPMLDHYAECDKTNALYERYKIGGKVPNNGARNRSHSGGDRGGGRGRGGSNYNNNNLNHQNNDDDANQQQNGGGGNNNGRGGHQKQRRGRLQ